MPLATTIQASLRCQPPTHLGSMRVHATTTTRRRPGPLQELPLAHFLPADPASAKSRAHPYASADAPYKLPTASRGGKRPACSPLVLSPAKRRILADEGVLLEPGARASTPRATGGSGRHAPAYFDALLRGARSPSRKLDFGAPGEGEDDDDASPRPSTREGPQGGDVTPRRRSERLRAKLAPSPELVRSPRSHAASSTACSSSASTRHTTPADTADALKPTAHVPMMIPRERPPLADPRSAHYPGFDIFVDRHICLPHVRDRLTSQLPPAAGVDGDGEKENAPVRRPHEKKGASFVGEDAPGKLQLVSPFVSPSAAGRSRSTTTTTPRTRTSYGSDMLFGRLDALMGEVSPAKSERAVAALLEAGFSPERTPKARSAGRRLLLKEADEAEGDELWEKVRLQLN
jgi:hypothetical protein